MTTRKLVVVVTGASRGIGRGVAKTFGALGATVHVTGRPRRGAHSEHPMEVSLRFLVAAV
jgi:NAD(P)-dependent dehydrogenase (short-subunit alcohol dehydrogenase family)